MEENNNNVQNNMPNEQINNNGNMNQNVGQMPNPQMMNNQMGYAQNVNPNAMMYNQQMMYQQQMMNNQNMVNGQQQMPNPQMMNNQMGYAQNINPSAMPNYYESNQAQMQSMPNTQGVNAQNMQMPVDQQVSMAAGAIEDGEGVLPKPSKKSQIIGTTITLVVVGLLAFWFIKRYCGL